MEELTDNDIELLNQLYLFVNEKCNNDHPLASAIIHKDNKIIYGLSSKSPLGYDVHAEHALVGNAHIYDNNNDNFLSLISMTRSFQDIDGNNTYKIKAPCGICRELLRYHYPNLYIIVPRNPEITIITKRNLNDLIKIKSKYLLPFPYISSKLPLESKIEDDIEIKIKKSKLNNTYNNLV
jgi:cytidine deaminase